MNEADTTKLAQELMEQHGLTGWTFGLDPRWAGNFCCYAQRLITISQPMSQRRDISEVRSIILHEIAHALVGAGHNHDEIWRDKDLSIGGKGERYLVDDEESRRPLSEKEIDALIDDACAGDTG